jgi:N-acetylglucosaminyldiphosphoundecaprenol N-acetyl-beta-D-mannosaminyltransferase
MEKFFKINYEFDRKQIHQAIAEQVSLKDPDYICVADGVILNNANRKPEYLDIVNGGMFSICDSSYVPLYIKWLHGKKYSQYCGSQIFEDIVRSKKYRMIFLGTSEKTLLGLKSNLIEWNQDVANMQFIELPFRKVNEFDYAAIAQLINNDGADIIWVALGAPKQEYFMHYLKPHLSHGVMIAVGAAFKFFSGTDEKRAPNWMIKSHLEFIYRIARSPKKQTKRCGWIVATLPKLLFQEWRQMSKHDDVEEQCGLSKATDSSIVQ